MKMPVFPWESFYLCRAHFFFLYRKAEWDFQKNSLYPDSEKKVKFLVISEGRDEQLLLKMIPVAYIEYETPTDGGIIKYRENIATSSVRRLQPNITIQWTGTKIMGREKSS